MEKLFFIETEKLSPLPNTASLITTKSSSISSLAAEKE